MLDCNLCGQNAWQGKGCPECPNYQNEHYMEGVGPQEGIDFFCVAESPHVPGVSSSLTQHTPWGFDVEAIVKRTISDTVITTGKYRHLRARFTYAVRCAVDKPNKKTRDGCAELFQPEILSCASSKHPIMIFALGPAVLQSLGVKVSGYKKLQGRMLDTTLDGRRVVIMPSLSKRQLTANPEHHEILARQLIQFLDAVCDVQANKPVQIITPTDMLIKDYRFPKSIRAVQKLVEEIVAYAPEGKDPDKHAISIDTETNTVFPHRKKLKMLSFVFSWGPGLAASIPVEHEESPFSLADVAPYIQQLLSCPKPKIFHNAKFDLKVLRRKGWDVEHLAWDTMLAEHLLAEAKKGYYDLKSLTQSFLPRYGGYEDELQAVNRKRILEHKATIVRDADAPKLTGAAKKIDEDYGFAFVPLKKLSVYGAIDADVTRQLALVQRKRMIEEQKMLNEKRKKIGTNRYFQMLAAPGTKEREPLKALMFQQLVPVTRTLARMEEVGMRVDRDYVQNLATEMGGSIRKLRLELRSMIRQDTFNEDFNPKSVAHLRKLLFTTGYKHPKTGETVCHRGEIPEDELPRTSTGLISTNAKFLRVLKNQYDCQFSDTLLQYRALTKARDTFIQNILVLSEEDGRMHTTFNIHGTATGRLCVSEDTLLDTTEGRLVISQLDLSNLQNVRVLTHKNRLRRILNVFYKGKEEMYRVTLTNGAQIEVTQNHRFFTPAGVQHLRELEEGSHVTALRNHSLASAGRSDLERRGLCHHLSPTEAKGTPVSQQRGGADAVKSRREDPFGAVAIQSITPIGVKEVWDIEVEEDHSFVAQGFVNHNSSVDENMQNIPKKIGEHNIKQSFIPTDPTSQVMMNADAKAAEVRLYAAYSRDANLIEALNDGLDPHSFFSSRVLNPATILQGVRDSDKDSVLALVGIDDVHDWSYEDFQKRGYYVGTEDDPGPDVEYGQKLGKLRGNIKRVVFGILYGAAPKKISSIVGIPEAQAAAIIESLFRMFPTIPEYISRTKEKVQYLGCVETFFGRRRRFNLRGMTFKMRNKAERQAVNMLIQSTSSEIILRVLNAVDEPIRRDFGGNLLITVHDSIVAEIPNKYVSQMKDFITEYGVRQVNAQYPWLPVPFLWDVEVGPSYGQLTDIDKYLKGNLQPPEISGDDYLEHEIKSDFENLDQ